MYFPSKKYWWLGLIIWVAILVPPVMLIKEGIYYHLFIWVPIVSFVSWIWFGTGYTISKNELKIKCGPIKYKIPLEQIKKIRKTNNQLTTADLVQNMRLKELKISTLLKIPLKLFCEPVRTIKVVSKMIKK